MNACTVSDEVLENVALRKPSFQVSTYANCPARNGNDGDRRYRMVHTLRQPNPWWAVDLGIPTVVYQVNFTNRQDYCGNNLFSYREQVNFTATVITTSVRVSLRV